MASTATLPDASAFFEALSFGADDLRAAKEAFRSSREFQRAAQAALRDAPEGAQGRQALLRATALYLLSRPEEVPGALQAAPDSPQATLLRGRAALENGDPAGAAAAFASLVGSAEDGASLLTDLATAAALNGDTATAQRAAARLPRGADQRYAEGVALESDGEYAEAIEKYEEALRLEPSHTRALFRLALRLDMRGEDARALETYRRLTQLTPVHVSALINLALLYEDEGRHAEAEVCYRKILKADPQNARARIGLKDVTASQTMFFDEDHERREDRRNQVMRTPISEFELSVRSRNCLAKMHIETLGDLVRKTEQELLAYKNFGETSLQEIKDILAQKGLRLGMVTDDDAPLFVSTRDDAQAELDALFGAGGGLLDDDAEEEPDPRNLPIEALDLSVRARRCMETLEIRSIGELLERSEADLMGAKNFGETSLDEIRAKLLTFGLALRLR
jgi:DNA-directed RNA polymerase subunit alpha